MPTNVTTFPLAVQTVPGPAVTLTARPDVAFALTVYVVVLVVVRMTGEVGTVDVKLTVCGRSFTTIGIEYDAVSPS